MATHSVADPPAASSTPELTPVTVLGDEVVSARPLTSIEQWALDRLWRDQLLGGMGKLASSVVVGLAIVVGLWLTLPQATLVFVFAIGPVLKSLRGRTAMLRRGWALRQDRQLAKLLVFDSPRGRCERLASSGLLWQRNGVDAAWRAGEG